MNNAQTIDDNILSFDGVYSMVSYNHDEKVIDSLQNIENEAFIDPLIFYNNGLVCSTSFFIPLKKERLTYLFKNEKEYMLNSVWGVYTVNDSTIKSICYIVFMGRGKAINDWALCHFEGTLVNKNEIKDWRMVPPYPLLTELESRFSYNHSFLKYLKTPKDYAFRKYHTKTEIDSNAVWINKYREKQTD